MTPPATPQPPLGLIAGEGVFPLLVARGARAAGRRVVCVAFHGSAWPGLKDEVDEFRWVSVARLGTWIRALKCAGCREAIMVGRVVKTKMYARTRYLQYIPDLTSARLWLTRLRRDRRPFTILNAIADTFEAAGVPLVDCTMYTKDQLTTPGVLTKRQPTPQQLDDARHGFALCKQLSGLDIGQALAVLRKDVIAVEALEGTNAMIERAGQLCKTGGWTLVKVANKHQDLRMDVPTVGVTTIEKLAAAGAACVALEAGRTTLLEREKVLAMADEHKIAVVGIDPAGAT